MQIAVLGIDLGKNSCSVVGLDERGQVVLRRRLRREGVIKLSSTLPTCIMAMEACCGAHHVGRQLQLQGHDVRLMSPEYVRPYIKAQKNDDRDAEGIAEAATRPTMRFVEIKDENQLDMQTLHRARDRLVAERTALINQLRAILLERGLTVPQGRRKLEIWLDMKTDEGKPALSRRTITLTMPASRHYPRHWTSERNCVGCVSWGCANLWTRQRPGGLARPCATTDNNRGETEITWYHQTRKWISKKDDHPRRARSSSNAFQICDASWRLVTGSTWSRSQEQSDRCTRSKVSAYRVGCVAKLPSLQRRRLGFGNPSITK